jgi:hypothetical protein
MKVMSGSGFGWFRKTAKGKSNGNSKNNSNSKDNGAGWRVSIPTHGAMKLRHEWGTRGFGVV